MSKIIGGAAVLHQVAVEAGRTRPLAKSAGSMSVSTHGPSGQNVSNPLARVHWSRPALQVAGGDVVGARVAEDDLVACSGGTSLQSRPITTASSAS